MNTDKCVERKSTELESLIETISKNNDRIRELLKHNHEAKDRLDSSANRLHPNAYWKNQEVAIKELVESDKAMTDLQLKSGHLQTLNEIIEQQEGIKDYIIRITNDILNTADFFDRTI